MAERLVVAYNFPPFNDGSAVTMAKRVVSWGEPVDVISKDMSDRRTADSSLESLMQPFVKHHRLVRGPTVFAGWKSVASFVEGGIQAVHDWGTTYPRLYSRSMFAHSHYLAAVIKKRGIAEHWTAEFSDPLARGVDGRPRRSEKIPDCALSRELRQNLPGWTEAMDGGVDNVLPFAQAIALAFADELVFTNAQQRTVMLQGLPQMVQQSLIARSTIAAHPTLPAEFYRERVAPRNGRVRIGYFGSLYPNRGAGEFLEGWATCPAAVRDAIDLEIFSDSPCDEVKRSAARLGLSSRVQVKRALPLRQFLLLASDFDALLVTDIATKPFNVPSPFLPSKVSDYRGSAAPIMALVHEGSPLDEVAPKYKAQLGDIKAVRSMLEQAVKDSAAVA